LKYIQNVQIDGQGAEWNSATGGAIHTNAIFLFDMLFWILLNTADKHDEARAYTRII
jgi:hypothetical protein